MVQRTSLETLVAALSAMPVVALLGPRQVGKTTLALEVARSISKNSLYLDLESDADMNKLSDPEAFFLRHENTLLILDEVQRKPDLFRIIRGIVDARKRQGEKSGHFLLLGSASRDLLQNTEETLAGRIRYLELGPFSVPEIALYEGDSFDLDKIWLRGGFPDSYLAPDNRESAQWRKDFASTYLERDLPRMGVGISPSHLSRFWKMLAHYQGNQVNTSDLGRSLELSHTSIRHYLDVLTDFYMIRQLPPYSGNLGKRLVKSPKIYIRDSGILHHLLNLSDMDSLFSHPAMGASWEGFVVENILSQLDSRWNACYYRTATGVELDLVLESPANEKWAIEVKRASAPKLGRGFFEACQDIGATQKWVINSGRDLYPMERGVEVIGLLPFLEELKKKQ